MLRFKQNDSYKRALSDMVEFFYKFQIKPTIKPITKSIMLITSKNVLDMFKIDLMNHRKARLALHYHLRIQPSEIDYMDYMDFEFLLTDLADLLRTKQEEEKKQYDSQKESMPNYSKQMKGMSNMKSPSFKTPSMPRF